MALVRGIPPRWTRPFAEGLDVEAVNSHIRAWQEVLGLLDWEIRFSPAALDAETFRASHDMDSIHRRGAIRLSADAPTSQVDRLIVHELLHALMAQMEDTLNRATDDLGADARAFLKGQWERSQEWVIERLASLITGTDWQAFHDDPVWETAFPVVD